MLVIGHSMGAVIAYDALWELTHLEGQSRQGRSASDASAAPWACTSCRTGCSVFAIHDGQRFPCNIRHWINIAAHGDLTALDPEVRDNFMPMIEQGCTESIEDRHRGVFNYFRNDKGLNMHRSYGYLVEQHVARAILAWWQGSADQACYAPETAAPLAGRAGMA